MKHLHINMMHCHTTLQKSKSQSIHSEDYQNEFGKLTGNALRQIPHHQAALLLRAGFGQGKQQHAGRGLRGRKWVVLVTVWEPLQSTAGRVMAEQPQSCCALYQGFHQESGAWRGHRSSLLIQALGQGPAAAGGGTQHTVHRSAAFSALGLTKSAWTAFNISHYLPVLLSPYPELLQASLEEKEYCSLSGPPLPQDWCRWCFFLFTAKAWEVGCSTERNLTVIFSCFNTARVGRDRSCTGHTLVTGHRMGWSWETSGESGLPTVLLQRVKLYLNISHSCSVNLLFICNPFKPFPSNITSKCHSSGPKGTVQTDLTVLFLTPSDPNTDNYWHQTEQEVSCCSWSQLF